MILVYILFGALFTVATSWAMGAILLRRWAGIFYRSEARLLAFMAGSACLSAVVFVLCVFHLARPGVFFAIGIASIVYALYSRADGVATKTFPPLPRLWRWIFVGVFSAFGIFYLLNAMAPDVSPDGVGYHLGVVARYSRARGFTLITDNFFANLSQGIEMLFLFAFRFGRHSAAAMVHFAFWIALALLILSFGRRIGHPAAGVAAAIFTAASPLIGIDGSSPYVDVALAAFVFALFYVLQVWAENLDQGLLLLIGLLAGFAYEVKYTGGVAALYAVLFVLWKSWRAGKPALRPALLVAACAFACMLPWMAKNVVEVHNPVSPFASRWFPSPYVHTSQQEGFNQYLRKYELTSYGELPLQLTVKGIKTSGFFGPLFLLAPLALFALRYPVGRQLLLAGAVFAATYFANIGARFLIPAIPFVALALALVFEKWKWLLLFLVAGHVIASTPPAYGRYAAGAWAVWHISPRAALRLEDEATYLTQYSDRYPVARMIDRLVPGGQKVFAFVPPPEAYTTRDVLVGWMAGPNETLQDFLLTPMVDDQTPTRILKFQFPERLEQRLRLVQTSRASTQWSVSELRFFDGGKEIQRASNWKLSAQPNPWDVQFAFDNNPVTRWRSWQPAEPGMYIQVDFPQRQAIDSLVVETSKDSQGTSLVVQELTPQAGWNTINAVPQESERLMRVSLRRSAAQELKTRGVRYLLIDDGVFGAKDFRVYPQAWGIRAIGQWKTARLYYIE